MQIMIGDLFMRKIKKKPIKKIILFGNPVLRKISKPIKNFDFTLEKDLNLIRETLESEKNGAALAAPQISISKKITIINYVGEYLELINPEILEFEGEQIDYEGCLSLPKMIGMVKRAKKIKFKYFDKTGIEHIEERTGDMARCIQHEIDHLNGILYIDRMTETFIINVETDEKIPIEQYSKI